MFAEECMLDWLPTEIWLHILSYVGPASLINASRTCFYLNQLCGASVKDYQSLECTYHIDVYNICWLINPLPIGLRRYIHWINGGYVPEIHSFQN